MRALLTAMIVSLCLLNGCQQMNEALPGILEAAQGAPKLDSQSIAAGLREALRVGSERAAAEASQSAAWAPGSQIRIPVPEELEPVAKALRSIGLGGEVERFEASMNAAAEEAATLAAPVFADAVRGLTFQDVYEIWRGHDSAATDYLRETTSPRLTELFQPIVERKLTEVGAVRVHDDLMARYNRIPLAPKPQFSLADYATQEALNGLFTLLAQEEAKIRQDPAARTTDLLRRVFGTQ